MLNKIKKYISKFAATAKTKINSMKKPIKWVIWAYFILVVLLVLTYYAAWCWQLFSGKADLRDLLSIIQEMIGAGAIGFITFICGCFVDINNNGIPDHMEEGNENDDEANNA